MMPANKHSHIQEDSKLVIALELFVLTQKRLIVNSCGTEKGVWKVPALGKSNASIEQGAKGSNADISSGSCKPHLFLQLPSWRYLHNVRRKKASY